MSTLITYESFFGNTEKIARAIAAGCGLDPETTVVRVRDVDPRQLGELDRLIVGSATRGFKPCPDTQHFLKAIPAGRLQGVKIAAYDTRIDIATVDNAFLTFMVRLFGYAAEPIDKALQKKGGIPAAPPAGFIVEDSEGPLRAGELERAAEWAKAIA